MPYAFFESIVVWVLASIGFPAVKFRSPELLLLLAIVPPIFLLSIWTLVRQRRSALLLGMRQPVFVRACALFLATFGLAAFAVALAEPYTIVVKQQPVYKGEAVQFIVDITPSQRAEDIQRVYVDSFGKVTISYLSRIEATKTEIALAVRRMNERGISYFCLSYFTRTYNILRECSDDVRAMLRTLERLDTSFSNEVGTNLLSAFGEDYSFVREVVPKDTRITAVVITDGGKEACRKSSGTVEVVLEDWKEEELKKRIVELSTKENIRIIPIGVGSDQYAPSPVFDTFGRKTYVTCDEVGGGTLMARLERGTIEKIAAWAGDSKRYFILDRSNQDKHELAAWLDSYMTANLVVDHTVPVESFSDEFLDGLKRRWPLGVFLVSAALALGVLGFIGRIFGRIFRKRSP